MKSYVFIFSLLILAGVNVDSSCYPKSFVNGQSVENISIVNNTDQSLNVTIPLPERSQADVQISKISLQDALYKATLNDSPAEIIKAVQAGADINMAKDGKTPLLFAIICSKYNSIETLLKLGASPDDICKQNAIKMKDPKTLLLLVKLGSVNFDLEIKEVLAKISCSIPGCRNSAKDCKSITDLIVELINHGGYDINEFWFSVLYLAYYRPIEGQEMVRFMLLHGANPNYDNVNGRKEKGYIETPLLCAVYYPNKQIVKTLIEFGADINQKIKPYAMGNYITVLSYVIERIGVGGSGVALKKEIMEFLLGIGASL